MTKHFSLPLLLTLALTLQLHAKPPSPTTTTTTEASFLTNIRQLTFEGKRAGEGYFSADGSKMVFQSEREPNNPFYQIYLLDLETGDTSRISPGTGKTTCAWIHPNNDHILFASTHLDPQSSALQKAEYQERTSNRVRKYSWDYDEKFDLFQYSISKKTLTNLTNTTGYDAEGAYSPDGTKIVFASNRHAYLPNTKLSPTDSERLKHDKQYFMEIYIADANGDNPTRLTHTNGYDGGPFFSADGKKICWRRFDEKGTTAEIYTMNIDGSNQRQITKIGAMSWAPYFHPSGDYLIFTNNTQGFANFELFIIDAEGTQKPIRITHTDGFDGLPVFSPDGKKLSWTSGRTSTNTSQIFLADWNDTAARQALNLTTTTNTNTQPHPTPNNHPDLTTTTPDITPKDLRTHVEYLASEQLEGRLTGTKGEQLATQYVATIFKKLNLQPFGNDNTYYDPFEFTAGVALGSNNHLTLTHNNQPNKTTTFTPDKDWRPLSFSKTGPVPPSDIVFAGYGIETPDHAIGNDGKPLQTYSSYAHLDVKDKWVLVFRYLPENITQQRRNELITYASLRNKALTARQKGARGLLIVSGPNSKVVEQLTPMSFDASLADSGLTVISITDHTASQLLAPTNKTLKQLQDQLDSGDLLGGINCTNLKLAAHIDIQQEKRTGRNVLGILTRTNQPDFHTPPLIIGAHIDHLGSNAGSNSRAKDNDTKKIHFGADDNASGTAAMLEIAQHLANLKSQGKLNLKRDILFAAWSGEELGLLGSNHFVQSMAKMIKGDPNANLQGMFAAALNMDMIGRFNQSLVLQGVGSSSIWPQEIEKRNAVIGLPITVQNDAHLATDSTTFYLRGIPTLNAFTGAHEDYHAPTDTPDKINYDKATDITRLISLIARSISTTHNLPDYIAMTAPKNQGTRGGLRVYLGTIPDYAQGDIKGVKLSGVSPIGPAAKAGVQAGDIITKLGPKEILNIYDYTSIMGELKIGEPTTITIERNGKPLELKITPGSRD